MIRCYVTGRIIPSSEKFYIVKRGECMLFFSQTVIDDVADFERVTEESPGPNSELIPVYEGHSMMSVDKDYWVVEGARTAKYLFSVRSISAILD